MPLTDAGRGKICDRIVIADAERLPVAGIGFRTPRIVWCWEPWNLMAEGVRLACGYRGTVEHGLECDNRS